MDASRQSSHGGGDAGENRKSGRALDQADHRHGRGRAVANRQSGLLRRRRTHDRVLRRNADWWRTRIAAQNRTHHGREERSVHRITDADLVCSSRPTQLADVVYQSRREAGRYDVGYCHIGQQATGMLFAARTLGYRCCCTTARSRTGRGAICRSRKSRRGGEAEERWLGCSRSTVPPFHRSTVLPRQFSHISGTHRPPPVTAHTVESPRDPNRGDSCAHVAYADNAGVLVRPRRGARPA